MRVVIADDALLVRAGLTRLLEAAGVEVVDAVGEVDALLAAVAVTKPDAAIVDIRMPPHYRTEGLDAAVRLARDQPDVAVLVLSQYVEADYAAALLADRSTGRGYLLKDRLFDADNLLRALYRVTDGDTVVDPAVVDAALAGPVAAGRLAALTERELDVLRLMAEGATDHAIAELLYVSAKTVATHTQHIFTKLDLPDGPRANRRVHAVLTYLREAVSGR